MPARNTKSLAAKISWVLFSAAVAAYPFLVPQFWVVNIGAYAVVLGTITLSLTFLAAYGGMVSWAQMSVAGISGYILAILSPHAATIGTPLPWPASLAAALLGGTLGGLLIGLAAVRTKGISLLMITLAIGMIFF